MRGDQATGETDFDGVAFELSADLDLVPQRGGVGNERVLNCRTANR